MNHSVKLRPFQTPNFAIADINPTAGEAPKFPLSDLSVETLSELCEQFRAEVFSRVGAALSLGS